MNQVTFLVVVQKHQRSIRNLVGGTLECCNGFLVYSPTFFPLSLAPTYTSFTSQIQRLGVCAESRKLWKANTHLSNLNPQPTMSGEKMHMSLSGILGTLPHTHPHIPQENIQYHNTMHPLSLTYTHSSAGM